MPLSLPIAHVVPSNIELKYLAVRPDYQRLGVASLLLQSGIRAAEKMGLDIFVTSTKAGRPVYLKVGFNLLAEDNQDNSNHDVEGEYSAYFSMIVQK
jgi:predicted N-acetyltransferase YhbS